MKLDIESYAFAIHAAYAEAADNDGQLNKHNPAIIVDLTDGTCYYGSALTKEQHEAVLDDLSQGLELYGDYDGEALTEEDARALAEVCATESQATLNDLIEQAE